MGSALSAKVRDGELKVVQAFNFADHKTKNAMNTLVKLEAACKRFVDDKKPIPGDLQFLAGLQRIDYVFAYPGEKDLVSAGRLLRELA